MHVAAKSYLALIILVLVSTGALAQTPWPDFMQRIGPGSSASPVAAILLDNVAVVQVTADVPSSKAKWSGRWNGWACSQWACDTKLIVEQITADGATIVYAFASANVKPYTTRLNAKFVDDELQATLGSGARIAYRMRVDGNVEFLWYKGADSVAGILSKER